MSGAEVRVRLLRADDAGPLARLYRANRAYLAPYEPLRADTFFTEQEQRQRVAISLADHAQERAYPYVIEVGGELAGRINVSEVSHGAFCNGRVGYWVAESTAGRGVASAALAQVVSECFGSKGLHRLEAATLTDNARSQAVLRNAGFERIGMAPRYLRIAGVWRDHYLFQRLSDDTAG